MILVDTSVWVDHLKRGNPALIDLLEDAAVVTHPFVNGEIALGISGRAREITDLLADLPALTVAAHDDVMNLVERRALAGKGIGWVDAHLLTAALLARMPLWTLDRALLSVAAKLAIGWRPDQTAGPGQG